MKNKLMSLCLAVSILSGCLWGCAAPSGTAGGSTGEQQTKSKTQEEKQQEGPMGRYAESSISISLEEGETAADIIQTGDQVLELYTVKDKKASRYIWTGEKWEKQDNSLLEGLEFPYGTLHMIWGEDKNRYVLYQGGDDYKTYMMKLAEGQEPMMLLDPVFSVKNDQGYYDVRPDFAAVSEEGLIFLSHSRVTDVYTPEGELVLSLPQLLFQHKAAKSASLHHPQQNRVDNGAEYGCQGKLFTQHPCPQQKHGHVKHADKKADWYSHGVGGKQGQSRGSSCNESVRHNEQHHCCRIHHISHQNFSQTEYNLSRRFFLFHDFSPFSLHRNEFPN